MFFATDEMNIESLLHLSSIFLKTLYTIDRILLKLVFFKNTVSKYLLSSHMQKIWVRSEDIKISKIPPWLHVDHMD